MEGIVDNLKVGNVDVFAVQDNRAAAGAYNGIYVLFLHDRIALQEYLITIDRHYFSGIFIHKVFCPSAQYARGQLSAHYFFELFFAGGYFLGEVEKV